ncbi:MAG TPA: CdaR family protein [Bacillales bacterium]|nr:CdaR family protein [Bacillales bacterium]
MDKLLRNNWFVKLLSFLIALLLYTVVTGDEPSSPFGLGAPTGGSSEQPRQMENVDLAVHYDEDKYIISNVRKKVTIQIQGSEALMMRTYLADDYEVFIDLTGKGPGTYTVPVQAKGFPDDLQIKVIPSQVTVSIHEKVAESFPVQIDLINEGQLAEGYTVGDPIVSPSQVKIIAGKDVIDRIAFVEGLVDVKGADDTVEESVTLSVYGQEGNKLNVEIVPPVVKVKVPIIGPSTTVPVQIERKGSLPDGLSIQSIEKKQREITLFGPQEVLDEIQFVKVPLNLDEISEDQTVELEVPIPEDVNKIAPEKIKVGVDVAKEVTKTLEDIPINVVGKSEGLFVTFLNPSDGVVNVTLTGPEGALESIEDQDIEAYIDVNGLSTGEHSVNIQVNSLQSNIGAEPAIDQAEIDITEKEADDSGSE